MPEQKMKITEEAFSDFTGHMCRAGFTNSISNEPLSERQQNHLAACFRAISVHSVCHHYTDCAVRIGGQNRST